uniref:Uncharacterized protein n=1 Tax=Triticum urartu TaxID=4572 RepID=A0A8R7QZS6_TRIUA
MSWPDPAGTPSLPPRSASRSIRTHRQSFGSSCSAAHGHGPWTSRTCGGCCCTGPGWSRPPRPSWWPPRGRSCPRRTLSATLSGRAPTSSTLSGPRGLTSPSTRSSPSSATCSRRAPSLQPESPKSQRSRTSTSLTVTTSSPSSTTSRISTNSTKSPSVGPGTTWTPSGDQRQDVGHPHRLDPGSAPEVRHHARVAVSHGVYHRHVPVATVRAPAGAAAGGRLRPTHRLQVRGDLGS